MNSPAPPEFAAALLEFAAPATDHDAVAADCGSIALTHGGPTARAIVLLHGLTASPLQFRAFGERLHARGHTVLIPRLPLHGHGDRMTEALRALSIAQLQATVDATLRHARALGTRTTVVGFSLGGLLALWAAQTYPEIALVVAVAPFVGVRRLARPIGRGLAAWTLRAPNRFVWWHPVRREAHSPTYGYPRYPTHAVARLYLFAEQILREAGRSAPAAERVAIVRNRREQAVSNADSDRLAHRWRRHAPERVAMHELDLPPSHDIIEPDRALAVHHLVYPQLERVIGD